MGPIPGLNLRGAMVLFSNPFAKFSHQSSAHLMICFAHFYHLGFGLFCHWLGFRVCFFRHQFQPPLFHQNNVQNDEKIIQPMEIFLKQ